jgi:hypothetical protein
LGGSEGSGGVEWIGKGSANQTVWLVP